MTPTILSATSRPPFPGRRRRLSGTRLLLAAGVVAAGAGPALSAEAAPRPVLYVATTGVDSNPGTEAAPKRTVQAAVNAATPGTTIRVAAGTYSGKIRLNKSGTVAAPYRITAASAGTVTLTAAVEPRPCTGGSPANERTVTIGQGADYWQLDGLTIENGVWIAGRDNNTIFRWYDNLADSGQWEVRRQVTSHGAYGPVKTPVVTAYLRDAAGSEIADPAVGIKLLDNTITGRGVHATFASDSTVRGNVIRDIDCGTGPGIWLINFSRGWLVSDNEVSNVAESETSHHMQEGIRIGGASDYNTITGNHVYDLPGDGRAYSTDTDSSWNWFHHNTAANVAQGYNEQMGGWGNVWEYNSVTGHRNYGFGFRLADAGLTAPSYNSSSTKSVVRCNSATNPAGTGRALGVGAIQESTFVGNNFPTAWFSPNSASYWTSAGNTWDGSSAFPTNTPPYDPSSC